MQGGYQGTYRPRDGVGMSPVAVAAAADSPVAPEGGATVRREGGVHDWGVGTAMGREQCKPGDVCWSVGAGGCWWSEWTTALLPDSCGGYGRSCGRGEEVGIGWCASTQLLLVALKYGGRVVGQHPLRTLQACVWQQSDRS